MAFLSRNLIAAAVLAALTLPTWAQGQVQHRTPTHATVVTTTTHTRAAVKPRHHVRRAAVVRQHHRRVHRSHRLHRTHHRMGR